MQLITALQESQKQHAELVRMYVSQFPVIVDALCGVIRAAGDAGLAERAPLVVRTASDPKAEQDKNGTDVQAEDVDEDVSKAEAPRTSPSTGSWFSVVQRLLDHVGPSIGPLLSNLRAWPIPSAPVSARRRQTRPSKSATGEQPRPSPTRRWTSVLPASRDAIRHNSTAPRPCIPAQEAPGPRRQRLTCQRHRRRCATS
jgi:hypothetical protein